MHVERLAIKRRLINLVAAGMHDDAGRRVNRHRETVRHAVGDPDELQGHLADGDRVARRDRAQPVARIQTMLLEGRCHERQRERRGVNGSIQQRPDVGYGADMVLVPVGQHHRRETADPLPHVAQIRNDEVDAR